jgi:hypothetical protein
MEKVCRHGKILFVLLAVIFTLSLAPALAMAVDIDDLLGPITLDSGSVDVGDSTTATIMIRTDDGTLPEGMSIAWAASNDDAVSIKQDPNAADSAIITGKAAASDVIITAQIQDTDGSYSYGVSKATIQVKGSGGGSGSGKQQ